MLNRALNIAICISNKSTNRMHKHGAVVFDNKKIIDCSPNHDNFLDHAEVLALIKSSLKGT